MKKNYLTILLFFFVATSIAQSEYKDVAAIFFSKCASCHNANGIANSDFTNYAGTAPYANTISNYIQNDIMPPWPPDTLYSRFVHERTINTAQKTAILQWITDGALPSSSGVPLPPTFPTYKLQGTPDIILTIPSYTSTAVSTDKYVCFSIPSGLTQDMYLRAYEVVPNDPSMIHHAVINVDEQGTSVDDLSGMCYNQPGDFSIGDYAPGAAPQIFPGVAPVKMGIKIKAGAKIVVQMHYPAGSSGKVDNTQIRLFFYPPATTGIRDLYNFVPLQNWSFVVAANQTALVSAQYVIPSIYGAISVYSTFPHSHQICKSIENYAMTPSNTKINLVKINDWRFHWQGFYMYKKMVKLPAGSALYAKHLFDNTVNNPNNPANPNPVNVNAGYNTYDEMVFDGFMLTSYQAGDENIDMEAILAADPLLTGIKEENNATTSQFINVFPNPFEDKITIAFTLNKPESVTLSVFNVLGEKVTTLFSQTEMDGYIQKTWDGTNQNGTNVNAGIYIYNLQIGEKTYSGKILLTPEN